MLQPASAHSLTLADVLPISASGPRMSTGPTSIDSMPTAHLFKSSNPPRLHCRPSTASSILRVPSHRTSDETQTKVRIFIYLLKLSPLVPCLLLDFPNSFQPFVLFHTYLYFCVLTTQLDLIHACRLGRLDRIERWTYTICAAPVSHHPGRGWGQRYQPLHAALCLERHDPRRQPANWYVRQSVCPVPQTFS